LKNRIYSAKEITNPTEIPFALRSEEKFAAGEGRKNVPTSVLAADDKSPLVRSANEEFPAQIEEDTERTKSSLARLTSNSIDRLERLMSEIQEMREFLRSEGERVQREIVSYAQLNQNVALAANKIKAETVGTWKSTVVAAGDTHSGAKQLSNGRDKLKRWPAP
jgi:hypothetical protein